MPSDIEKKRQARLAETFGLLIIVLVILAITLVRYSRVWNWSLH